MPPKKHSKKSSKQTPARTNDRPHASTTAARPAPSAVLDALDRVLEESEESSLDEQANSEVEEDSEDGNSTDQGKQGQDLAEAAELEGEAEEEEESSDGDTPVTIPQKRAIKTVAPLKAKSFTLYRCVLRELNP
jgi:hypothetical protein